MKSTSNSKKLIIVVIVIVLIGAIAYYFLSGSSTNQTATSSLQTQTASKTSTTTNQVINQDVSFLNTILSLNKITIDTSIFSSDSFKALNDNTVDIKSDDVVGRTNPFSPFDQTIPADNSTMLPAISPTDIVPNVDTTITTTTTTQTTKALPSVKIQTSTTTTNKKK